jgi:hypothetical protein
MILQKLERPSVVLWAACGSCPDSGYQVEVRALGTLRQAETRSFRVVSANWGSDRGEFYFFHTVCSDLS